MSEEALKEIAWALHRLGNADAITDMGAIEALGMQVARVADGLGAIADAIIYQTHYGKKTA